MDIVMDWKCRMLSRMVHGILANAVECMKKPSTKLGGPGLGESARLPQKKVVTAVALAS